MIEINAVWFLSVSLLIVAFLGITLIAKFLTSPFDGIVFSFARVFPYEVVENNEKYAVFYKSFLYLFSIMCFFPLFTLTSARVRFDAFHMSSIILGFSGVCFVFLNFFDATHTKVHLLLFVLFGCLTLLGNLISGFTSATYLIMDRYFEVNRPFTIVKVIISFMLTILQIGIFVNPKLLHWAKLEKNEAGQVIRPKKFPLAYSEWASFLILTLSVLTLYISIIK